MRIAGTTVIARAWKLLVLSEKLGIVFTVVFSATPGQAHHSYADYDADKLTVFAGTITEVYWGNPHILLTVNDGQQDMRIEWITTTGAIKTNVAQDRFSAGEHIIVTGSRNRHPERRIMTRIVSLQLPDKHWQWVIPSRKNQ